MVEALISVGIPEDRISDVGSQIQIVPAQDGSVLVTGFQSIFFDPLVISTLAGPAGVTIGQEAISTSGGECSYISLPAPELLVLGLPGSGGCPSLSDPAWDQARMIANALATAATGGGAPAPGAGGGGTPSSPGSGAPAAGARTGGTTEDAIAATRAFISDPPDDLTDVWASPGLSFSDGAYEISGAGVSTTDPSHAFVCALSTVKGPAFEPNAPDGFYTLLRFKLRAEANGWEVGAIDGPNYVWPDDGSIYDAPEDVANPDPALCPGRDP
ncbi:hypothetical protein [Miltoncostaea oceani]|uniref:hypothetical protein n=1 Tax=Miltoncostaea oceani TaxID=2843216 RepID=UPI001C3C815C|nr:hypothetical protein [Miltoncostaea oceani]